MTERIARASAPGKVILYGEHSVVYGRPAIAVPVSQLRARARVQARPPGQGLRIDALDLKESFLLSDAPIHHPLAAIARVTLSYCKVDEPDALLTIESDLPIGAGLGSGAAVSVAVARALAAFVGCELPTETTSALTYEIEKLHHGTPSGIDNTVVAWERPVYFVKDKPLQLFSIGASFDLVIADSGRSGSTRAAVAGVRRRWQEHQAAYEALFDHMGFIARQARHAIERGDVENLGALMDENQVLLVKIGVSSPTLDELVAAAREAGALGAKLTGAGLGGNVIALPGEGGTEEVTRALRRAGAAQVWHTQVKG